MSTNEEPIIAIIAPNPENLVCARCGSAEVECLDWVRVNDDYFVGGSESIPADDYWCPTCEIHEEPIHAKEYCETKGHIGNPCTVCGAREAPGGDKP